MTPEERAVINTAIKWRQAIPGRDRDIKLTIELERVIWELITSCPQCNRDTHTCGGCGAEVGHGEYTCSDCEDRCLCSKTERQYCHSSKCHGGDDLPAEPEIHTASTVATAELSAALERRRHAFFGNGRTCRKSIEGTGDSFIRCGLTREEHADPDELIWHARTMKDARRGDQIRPAGSDMPNGTAVTDRLLPPDPDGQDRGTWHVVPGASGKHWDDHVVQPGEVWLCLDGGAPRNVNPDFPIEILLTRAEIAAIEALGWDSRESLTTE